VVKVKRVVKEKRGVKVKSSEGEERCEGEEGSENRETSNTREDNVVPPNEVGLEECVAKDVVADFIPSATYNFIHQDQF
jgi:hypothetical protein